jgi:hypothetical protein
MSADGRALVEWRRFDVGERVRVRLSRECPWFSDQAFTDHTEAVDGAVGSICLVADAATFADGHRFFVNFEQPWPAMVFYGERRPGASGSYAAAELEPVAPPDSVA